MLLSKKRVSVFLFIGVIFFALGTVFYNNELITIGKYTFNPFLGLGVLFFGIGLIKPILKMMK